MVDRKEETAPRNVDITDHFSLKNWQTEGDNIFEKCHFVRKMGRHVHPSIFWPEMGKKDFDFLLLVLQR